MIKTKNYKDEKLKGEEAFKNLTNAFLVVIVTTIIYLLIYPFLISYIFGVFREEYPDFIFKETEFALPSIRSRLDLVGILTYIFFIISNVIIAIGLYRGIYRIIVVLSIVLSSILTFGIYSFFVLTLGTIITAYEYNMSESLYEVFYLEGWNYSLSILPIIFIFLLTFTITLILINKTYGEKIRSITEKEKVGTKRIM